MIPFSKYRRYDRERPKVGRVFIVPGSIPSSALVVDYRQLLIDRVEEPTLQAKLQQARSGNIGAKDELTAHLRWISYSVAYGFARKSRFLLGHKRATVMEEAIAQATIAIHIAVKRLMKTDRGDEPSIERYVRRVVWAELRKMDRLGDSDIHVPYSTNSTRAEGEEYHDLTRSYPTRLPQSLGRDCEEHALERAGCGVVREKQNGKAYTPASRLHNSMSAESRLEWKEHLERFEQRDIEIIDLRRAGYGLKVIARILSTTEGTVKYRLKKMRQVCELHGFTLPGVITAPVTPVNAIDQALAVEATSDAHVTLAAGLGSEPASRDTWASQSV